MLNQDLLYKQAVEYIAAYIEGTQKLLKDPQPELEGMADRLSFCLEILRDNEYYFK